MQPEGVGGVRAPLRILDARSAEDRAATGLGSRPRAWADESMPTTVQGVLHCPNAILVRNRECPPATWWARPCHEELLGRERVAFLRSALQHGIRGETWFVWFTSPRCLTLSISS